MARSRASRLTVTDEELRIFENSYDAASSFYRYVLERVSMSAVYREVQGGAGSRAFWITTDIRAQILARKHPIMFARWLALYRMGVEQ